MKNPFQPYVNRFSESKFWNKLRRYARSAGTKTVYSALLLFFAYRRRETPLWAKNIILGALGYFLAPIDAVPDLTPVLGYTDDLGVLAVGLVTIAAYVDDEVRGRARTQLGKWFKDVDEAELAEVDKKL